MYENAFNKIERDLRAEEGIANELDYVEQTSWVLFLKYLHDLETERADRAELDGDDYMPIITGEFRWDKWAAPKKDGEFDHNAARIGDDLIKFVDQELFPYLASFRQSATSPQTIQYKIGEVFTELRNKFRSGYILRDVLEAVDGLSFGTQEERHELSSLYETRIRRMGNAGRNGGEYYTPRPLIRAMIKVLDPKIGETIYDGAVGSAGFLCEAYDYLRRPDLSAAEYETLQTKTFYGQEKKGLAYIIGIMNMVLHGIEAPNLIHSNTLNENVMDIQEKDRHDIILANPPFGGGERREVQQNFPIRTGETAYLFLQHFIRKLKAGGRAAIVIKNTFLSNTDSAAVALRKELLEATELHTIVDCPPGTFQGAVVRTVVLFFEKGSPTRDIWYFQLDPGRSLGKTNPLNDDDLSEFVELQRSRSTGEHSWMVNRADLDEDSFDLSVKNPNEPNGHPKRSAESILDELLSRSNEATTFLESLEEILEGFSTVIPDHVDNAATTTLGDICEIQSGAGFPVKYQGQSSGDYPFYKVSDMNLPGNEWELSAANHYVSEAVRNELRAKIFPEGAIVFPKVGGAISTNKKRVVRVQGCVDNNVMGLIPDQTKVVPSYLHEWLHAFDIYEFSNKANPPSITQKTVSGWPIKLPPKDEQEDIVTLIVELRAKIQTLLEGFKSQIEGVEEFQKSLVKNAFSDK